MEKIEITKHKPHISYNKTWYCIGSVFNKEIIGQGESPSSAYWDWLGGVGEVASRDIYGFACPRCNFH